MRSTFALTAFAIATFATPAVFISTPAAALTCGIDAPAGWERPGGFCDALKSIRSLSTPVTGSQAPAVVIATTDCHDEASLPHLRSLLRNLDIGERIHVADREEGGCIGVE